VKRREARARSSRPSRPQWAVAGGAALPHRALAAGSNGGEHCPGSCPNPAAAIFVQSVAAVRRPLQRYLPALNPRSVAYPALTSRLQQPVARGQSRRQHAGPIGLTYALTVAPSGSFTAYVVFASGWPTVARCPGQRKVANATRARVRPRGRCPSPSPAQWAEHWSPAAGPGPPQSR
jgi:hypothetical protein